MSVRQAINDHPVYAGIVVILAVLVLVWRGFSGGETTKSPPLASQVYFSSDDGATWKAGALQDLTTLGGPPRAHVFRCSKEGKEFAGYLERFNLKMMPPGAKPPTAFLLSPMPGLVELKRPGEKAWVSGNSPSAQAIRKVKCPAKDDAEVTEVMP